MLEIKTVTIIGATGIMGINIAGIFAAFGNAKVYLIGRSKEKVQASIPKIISSVKADCIRKNLIPADFSMLEECIKESDLVFESSIEDIKVKEDLARRVNAQLKSGAVSCTGTSGLSITEIAESYSAENRGCFFGVHLFNPPYSMPLCELISTDYTDSTIKEELKRYLQDTLLRTVVEVKDSPAFLGNRIGFQFINEALQYAEKYKYNGGIDYIDSILGPFTGRAMAPLVTADFVGLDIHKAIVDNVYSNSDDYSNKSFKLPDFCEKLIASNKLGRKTGAGLYKTVRFEDGSKKQLVWDIISEKYRDQMAYVFPFAENMKNNIAEGNYQEAFEELINNHSTEAEICLAFLLKYIVYSMYTAKSVGYSVEAADDVMATGFNWCPPLALYGAIGRVADVKKLIKTRLSEICEKIDLDDLLSNTPDSKYDYRPYMKSAR